jgi:alpha-galactosidase
MNRDITEPHPDGRPVAHRYIDGLHDLIDRLRAAHPSLEIETCASGGGRCDYGILQRTDRVWVSDNNDALDRLRINRGASLFLPLRIMGTHVGPEVCHTTGRRLSLDLRAHVAMFGHFGLELDIRQLSDKETERLKTHIANYKRFRSLIHDGLYWRIESHGPDHLIDAVTSDDKTEALLRVVRVDSKRLGQGTTAFIPGLDLDRAYTLTPIQPLSASVESCLAPALREGKLQLTGRMLAAAGLSLYLPRPETSLLVHLKA